MQYHHEHSRSHRNREEKISFQHHQSFKNGFFVYFAFPQKWRNSNIVWELYKRNTAILFNFFLRKNNVEEVGFFEDENILL